MVNLHFQLHLNVLALVDKLIRLAQFLLFLLQKALKIVISSLFLSDNLNVFLLHLFALISFDDERPPLAF